MSDDDDLLAELAGILTGILYVQNSEDANEGSRQLGEAVAENPNEVMLLLARIGALGVGGFDNDIRKLCMISLVHIMFKPSEQLLLRGHTSSSRNLSWFDAIPESIRDKIEKVLVDGLRMETDLNLRHELGKYVAKWTKECNRRQRQCDRIPPLLVELTRSDQPWHRRTAFQMMADAPVILRNSLEEGSITVEDVASIIRAGFNDPSVDVQVQSIEALSNMITIEGQPIFEGDEPRTSLLREAFQYVASSSRIEVNHSLDPLADIACLRPSALVSMIDDIWTFLLRLMSPPTYGQIPYEFSSDPMIDCTFEDWVDVGHMSSEMFLDLARAYPKKLNRPKRRHLLKTFIGVQLGAHISELHDQGDCHDWITAEEPSEEPRLYAEEALSNLATVIKSEALYQETIVHAAELLRMADWRARYCALAALSSVIEETAEIDSVLEDIPSLYNFVDGARSDDHPRVRNGWVNLIGSICRNVSSEKRKPQFLPILAGSMLMLSDTIPRIRADAAMTMRALFDGATITDHPWLGLPNLANVSRAMFQSYYNSPDFVRGQIMWALKTLVVFAGPLCLDMYKPWMGFITSQLDQPGGSLPTRMISISVAVTIGQVVGKKVFISDAMVLATQLLRCQNDISEEDEDVEPTDLMAAWSDLAAIIGRDFAPMLPEFMPDLLELASREPDTSETPSQDLMAAPAPPSSEAMRQKGRALVIIRKLVAVMGGEYSAWFVQTGSIVTAAVTRRFPADVREIALPILPVLMRSALESRRMTGLPAVVEDVYDYYLYPFLDASGWGTDYSTLQTSYRTLAETLELIQEPPTNPTFIPIFLHKFLLQTASIIQMTKGRQIDREKDGLLYAAEYDDEEMEEITHAIEEEFEALDYLNRLMRAFARSVHDRATQSIIESIVQDIVNLRPAEGGVKWPEDGAAK